jgi:hypothetical protein
VLRLEWCEECDDSSTIVDDREEEVGFEEQARRVWVIGLSCGHEIVLREGPVGG